MTRLETFAFFAALLFSSACFASEITRQDVAGLIKAMDSTYEKEEWSKLREFYDPKAQIIITDSAEAGGKAALMEPAEWVYALRTNASQPKNASRDVREEFIKVSEDGRTAVVYREIVERVTSIDGSVESRSYNETFEIEMRGGKLVVLRESATSRER